MSRCETCQHYENHPTSLTCYCHYSNVSWKRWSAKVRKPYEIRCEYKKKEFTCNDCKGHNVNKALILSSSEGTMVCKKCIDKHSREEAEAKLNEE